MTNMATSLQSASKVFICWKVAFQIFVILPNIIKKFYFIVIHFFILT